MDKQARQLGPIVVGLDGSNGAQRALEWASARALEAGSAIVGVHVLTYSKEFAGDLSTKTWTTWRRNLERDLAGPWTASARDAGVHIETTMVEADRPDEGILRVAREHRAGLIVLGAHGRGALGDRLLGGTTYKVAHRAHTPVVIIPPDWQPEDP